MGADPRDSTAEQGGGQAVAELVRERGHVHARHPGPPGPQQRPGQCRADERTGRHRRRGREVGHLLGDPGVQPRHGVRSGQGPHDRGEQQHRDDEPHGWILLGQAGSVELLLESGPSAMGLAQVGDDVVDVCLVLGAGSESAHGGQSPRGEAVVLRAGLDQLVLDELTVDRQDRDRVDPCSQRARARARHRFGGSATRS